jgi:hypothetical protein
LVGVEKFYCAKADNFKESAGEESEAVAGGTERKKGHLGNILLITLSQL